MSWIVVSKKDGSPVMNREKYEVLTAWEWLARFNLSVKDGGK